MILALVAAIAAASPTCMVKDAPPCDRAALAIVRHFTETRAVCPPKAPSGPQMFALMRYWVLARPAPRTFEQAVTEAAIAAWPCP